MAFRFIHSADLHLGHRFGNLPEDARGRLVEARHQIIGTLARAARDHGAQHILIAGDIFDTETPTDPVWRQAVAAMGADPGLHWWLIPGSHDSLAAESLWSRFRRHATANVHLIDDVEPIEIAPGVMLLPAPVPHRHPGRDLTAWMPGCDTDPRHFRIGLAHGVVRNFCEEGTAAEGIIPPDIPPDRAETARLDYLALGDWHGQVQIGPRTRYCGTPERDSFHHDGKGVCLAVTLTDPGALPGVEVFPTGKFTWADEDLPLVPGEPADEALLALLPKDNRRDHLFRIRASGRATLAEQAALAHAAEAVAPEFCHFGLDLSGLATEFTLADLDGIDRDGALRATAEALRRSAEDEDRDGAAQRFAAAALNRLYGYLREDGKTPPT